MFDSVRPHRRQPPRLPCPWDSPGKNTGVGCHFLLQCVKVKSESEADQSCPTLSDPMDHSLPGSSVHGIFQARVLEWGAIAFSGLNAYYVPNAAWAVEFTIRYLCWVNKAMVLALANSYPCQKTTKYIITGLNTLSCLGKPEKAAKRKNSLTETWRMNMNCLDGDYGYSLRKNRLCKDRKVAKTRRERFNIDGTQAEHQGHKLQALLPHYWFTLPP